MGKQCKQGATIDSMEIMKILPHRYPMLLIDTILEYDAGIYAVAKKLFSCNEAYFQGHYPEKPIAPGTLLLEGLSQTATFAILSGDNWGGNLLFTGVNKLRFFKTVFPGDCVIYRAEIIKNRHGLWSVNGEGMVEGEVCINAEMTFVNRGMTES